MMVKVMPNPQLGQNRCTALTDPAAAVGAEELVKVLVCSVTEDQSIVPDHWVFAERRSQNTFEAPGVSSNINCVG
jgi:hypothetical protein